MRVFLLHDLATRSQKDLCTDVSGGGDWGLGIRDWGLRGTTRKIMPGKYALPKKGNFFLHPTPRLE
ncbi:hypothetical protein NIES4073_32250 [Kalymmatonema gypsitolerans NIES-4073]|nr:hypothetical protein NIES4073_32250 [Scytonema sp. NIES-4073]